MSEKIETQELIELEIAKEILKKATLYKQESKQKDKKKERLARNRVQKFKVLLGERNAKRT